MRYIYTPSQMKYADHETIHEYGIPQMVLMERAALEVRREIFAFYNREMPKTTRFLIAAGTGNNGADAVALGRILFLEGYHVDIWIDNNIGKYSQGLLNQLNICKKYGMITYDHIEQLSTTYEVVVDGMFGIGLSRMLQSEMLDRIAYINKLNGIKVAIDIPSGLHGETGKSMGAIFCADLTVTFGAVKTGMLFSTSREFCGVIKTVDIGIPVNRISITGNRGYTLPIEDIHDLCLPQRIQNAHKGVYGKILILAGNQETPGAAILSVNSAFRSGAGMVKILTDPGVRKLLIGSVPEVMYHDCNDLNSYSKQVEWCDSIVIGPGLGINENSLNNMHAILDTVLESSNNGISITIDADGINIISMYRELEEKCMTLAKRGHNIVFTPHIGEFSRLLDVSVKELKSNILKYIQCYCEKTNCTVVCKDSVTIVGAIDAEGNFRYYMNQSGNNGMATAGSGDVLSGILGTILAQAYLLEEKDIITCLCDKQFFSVCTGVFLHGKAGDIAAQNLGETSMKAGDIIEQLMILFKQLRRA